MYSLLKRLAALLAVVALTMVHAVPVSAHAGVSEADIDLLARLISAEARGEPYVGQVAVGAVVLNRVQSKQFPNNLRSVIYQGNGRQFESVLIGTIYQPAAASSRRAARDALNGWDPAKGALFFFNPAKTSNKFLWSRPHAITIGQHRFTY